MSNKNTSLAKSQALGHLAPIAVKGLKAAIKSELGQELMSEAKQAIINRVRSKISSSNNSSFRDVSAPVAIQQAVRTGHKFLSEGTGKGMRLKGTALAAIIKTDASASADQACAQPVYEVINGTLTSTNKMHSLTFELLTMGLLPWYFGEVFAQWKLNALTVHYVPQATTSTNGSITMAYSMDTAGWNAIQWGRGVINNANFSNTGNKEAIISNYENNYSGPVWQPASVKLNVRPSWKFCTNYASSAFFNPTFLTGDFTGQPQVNLFTNGCLPVTLSGTTVNNGIYGRIYLEYDISYRNCDPLAYYVQETPLPTISIHEMYIERYRHSRDSNVRQEESGKKAPSDDPVTESGEVSSRCMIRSPEPHDRGDYVLVKRSLN